MTSTFTSTSAAEAAAADARRGYWSITVHSAVTCYVLLEDGAGLNVTSSFYTKSLTQGQTFECPPNYKGRISAILSGAGTALITSIRV